MQISPEGRAGLWLALVALGGTGALAVALDQPSIGWALIALAAVGAIALACNHIYERIGLSWNGERRSKTQSNVDVHSPGARILSPVTEQKEDNIKRAKLLSNLRIKYPERIIADVTPDYLADLYKDRMTVQADSDVRPFVGKWVILTGPIDDITLRDDYATISLKLTGHGRVLMFLIKRGMTV
jgi:hypothetical protein